MRSYDLAAQALTVSLMLIIAAAALATIPPPPRVSAVAQATASIRIVRAVRLKLDGSANVDAPPAREVVIGAPGGAPQRVKLIEFE
jgi:hypothetical protein